MFDGLSWNSIFRKNEFSWNIFKQATCRLFRSRTIKRKCKLSARAISLILQRVIFSANGSTEKTINVCHCANYETLSKSHAQTKWIYENEHLLFELKIWISPRTSPSHSHCLTQTSSQTLNSIVIINWRLSIQHRLPNGRVLQKEFHFDFAWKKFRPPQKRNDKFLSHQNDGFKWFTDNERKTVGSIFEWNNFDGILTDEYSWQSQRWKRKNNLLELI